MCCADYYIYRQLFLVPPLPINRAGMILCSARLRGGIRRKAIFSLCRHCNKKNAAKTYSDFKIYLHHHLILTALLTLAFYLFFNQYVNIPRIFSLGLFLAVRLPSKPAVTHIPRFLIPLIIIALSAYLLNCYLNSYRRLYLKDFNCSI